MSPVLEFEPLSTLPGWRFGVAIEVELKRGESMDAVTIAAIEGEHPVFGLRRRFLMPAGLEPREQGVCVRYRYPDPGLYELRRLERGVVTRRAILLDEWRRVFEMPWDVVELVAPLLESLRPEPALKVGKRRRKKSTGDAAEKENPSAPCGVEGSVSTAAPSR